MSCILKSFSTRVELGAGATFDWTFFGRIVIGTVRVGRETMGKERIEFQNVKKLHQKHFSRTSKIFQIQKNSFDDVVIARAEPTVRISKLF
jgi:hypothetical protein